MAHQQAISLRRNQAQIDRILPVLIEGAGVAEPAGRTDSDGRRARRPHAPAEPTVIGRTYRDTPEVDGFVFARGQALLGEFATVRITDALPYDLVGELVTT